MNEKTLQFNDFILIKSLNYILINKKECHRSKEPIGLFLVNVDQIVVSDKFKHNKKSF